MRRPERNGLHLWEIPQQLRQLDDSPDLRSHNSLHLEYLVKLHHAVHLTQSREPDNGRQDWVRPHTISNDERSVLFRRLESRISRSRLDVASDNLS